MIDRNEPVPEDKRIVFRIGINVGDIIIDGDDIFGDGVNVAARLEALCEPGGLCISRGANEQIRDKLSLAFADLGEQTVKNIARSVGVFGLAATDIAALPEEALPELPGEASRDAVDHAGTTDPLLPLVGWRADRLLVHRPGAAAGQDRQLDDASGERPGKPDLASSLARSGARPHARPLRRARQRACRTGTSTRFPSTPGCAIWKLWWMPPESRTFDLLGISQGCAVSIAYAVRHPERVNRLVLYGGFSARLGKAGAQRGG